MPTKKGRPEHLTYEGKPLLRSENKIFLGDFNEKYITVFTINSTKDVNGLKVADDVTIQLLEKNGADISTARVVKKAERDTLYAALDIGAFWLEDALHPDD